MTVNATAERIDVDDHECEDEVILVNGLWVCGICDDVLDPRDLACSGCGHFPCTCDDAYERLKDERMGL